MKTKNEIYIILILFFIENILINLNSASYIYKMNLKKSYYILVTTWLLII